MDEDDNSSYSDYENDDYDGRYELLNEMYDFETEFDLQEKENDKYYLGMYMSIKDVRLMSSGFLVGEKPILFFGNAISTELFFRYKYSQVITYMKSIIMCRNSTPVIDIMQLKISDDGLYLAIIKTYWISLIQRHWKKIMKQKKEYIELQKNIQYIRNREISNKQKRPRFSIIGMLSMYQQRKNSKNREQHMDFP